MEYKPILAHCLNLLEDDGIIIVEFDKNRNLDLEQIINELDNCYEIIKEKKYGRCLITLLQKSCNII